VPPQNSRFAEIIHAHAYSNRGHGATQKVFVAEIIQASAQFSGIALFCTPVEEL